MTKLSLSIIVLAFSTTAASLSQVIEKDSLALVALYRSTNGESWTDNENWLSGPVSTWSGITVSNGRVTSINLVAKGLSGLIPGEIGDLTELTFVKLCNNEITGEIPVELGRLTKLKMLASRFNKHTGNLPVELGNLVNLTYLTFGHNLISGEIPHELGNLVNLNSLFLFDNQLSGKIPVELGKMASLKDLSLRNNQLAGSIPPEIGSLSQLNSIYLNNNQLSGSIPPDLGNLHQLWNLTLHHNKLEGAIPRELGSIENLVSMDLGKNEFTGEIPIEFGNLGRLDTLLLNDNKFVGTLPVSLSGLHLKKFWFSDTNLHEPLEPSFQSWLQSIQDLRSTGLTNTETFEYKPHLENSLRENYPDPFKYLTTIRFQLRESGHVTLSVFNQIGKEIIRLIDEEMMDGSYVTEWDGRETSGSNAPSGVYFYILKAGDFKAVRRMVLLK